MSSKVKPRQLRKPRNMVVVGMLTSKKGEKLRHRTDRRALEREDVRRIIREWD